MQKFHVVIGGVVVVLSFLLAIIVAEPVSAFSQAGFITPTPRAVSDPVQEELLKQEVALLQKQNQQLLDTLYWSLGISFAIVLSAIGAVLYFNFRFSEREKQQMQEALVREIERNVSKYEEKSREDLKEFVQREVRRQVGRLQRGLEDLQSQILFMEYSLKEMEAEKWSEKGVKGNEFTAYLEMLEIALKTDWEYGITNALDGLTNVVSEEIGFLDAKDISDLHELLSRLPKRYQGVADRLWQIVKNRKV